MSDRQGAQRWWRLLRPAEWAASLFVAYGVLMVAARSGWEAALTVRPVTSNGASRVLVALFVVIAVDLVRRAVAELARVPPGLRRVLALVHGVAWLPATLALYGGVSDAGLWGGFGAARTEDRLHLVMVAALRVAVLAFPLPALWAMVVLHAARLGRVMPVALVGEVGRGVLAGVREWLPLAVMIPAYWWVAEIIGAPEQDRDGWMQAVDRALFLGRDPLDLAERLISRPLSEWFAFCYSLFGLLFPLTLAAALMKGGRGALREGITLLTIGMAITFFTYTVIPVKGPVLTRTFAVPLTDYAMEEMKAALMDSTRIAWDCFPSFHTAGTLLMGAVCWRYVRGLAWVLAPVVLSMPLACVYLRYHYVTDVLAGVALFLAVDRWGRRWLEVSAA